MTTMAPTGRPRSWQSSGRAERSRYFFDREPDGSVRLRIRFSPEEADLIEEAAGDTGLLLWLHRTWRDAADREVDQARAEQPTPPSTTR